MISNKYIVLIGFMVMVGAQWFFPLQTIFNKEKTIEEGVSYTFKSSPIYPHKVEKGRYINLNLSLPLIKVENAQEWERGERIFAELTTDSSGFAGISRITKEKPLSGDYIDAEVGYVLYDESNQLSVQFPFESYYLNNSEIVDLLNKGMMDTTMQVLVNVRVKNGDAVVTDMIVNGVSVKSE